MKFLFMAMLMACLCLEVKAQDYSSLPSVQKLIKDQVTGYLVAGFENNSKTMTLPEALKIVLDSINANPKSQNSILLRENFKLITDYFTKITHFGKADNVLLYSSELPVTFARFNNALTFVQNKIYPNFQLNTNRLDVDQRAEYLIKNILLPSLVNFLPLLKDERIQYFALNSGCRTKDFTQEISFGHGELTSILISKQTLLKYTNAEISDAEVLKEAIFYNWNENSSALRKLSF